MKIMSSIEHAKLMKELKETRQENFDLALEVAALSKQLSDKQSLIDDLHGEVSYYQEDGEHSLQMYHDLRSKLEDALNV